MRAFEFRTFDHQDQFPHRDPELEGSKCIADELRRSFFLGAQLSRMLSKGGASNCRSLNCRHVFSTPGSSSRIARRKSSSRRKTCPFRDRGLEPPRATVYMEALRHARQARRSGGGGSGFGARCPRAPSTAWSGTACWRCSGFASFSFWFCVRVQTRKTSRTLDPLAASVQIDLRCREPPPWPAHRRRTRSVRCGF